MIDPDDCPLDIYHDSHARTWLAGCGFLILAGLLMMVGAWIGTLAQ